MIFENWFNHVQSANLHGRGLLRPKWQFQRAFDDCNSDSHAGALGCSFGHSDLKPLSKTIWKFATKERKSLERYRDWSSHNENPPQSFGIQISTVRFPKATFSSSFSGEFFRNLHKEACEIQNAGTRYPCRRFQDLYQALETSILFSDMSCSESGRSMFIKFIWLLQNAQSIVVIRSHSHQQLPSHFAWLRWCWIDLISELIPLCRRLYVAVDSYYFDISSSREFELEIWYF